MPFETKLIVSEVDESRWQLVNDLVYRGNKDVFTVPAGFKTDFASVPKLFWNILPPTGRYTKAAVLHDWLYSTHAVSKEDADGIFRRVMEEEKVGTIKRNIMWLAVKWFGGSAYNK
jgi:hypothetical protein